MRRSEEGFLLVEVLVTLAVLSFGIVMVLATMQRCVAAAKASKNYTAALNVLEAKLWELQNKGELRDAGNSDFRCVVEKTGQPGLPLTRAKLSVFWNEKDGEKRVWLNTYIKDGR